MNDDLDSVTNDGRRFSRRRVLGAGATLAAVGIAGCSSSGSNDPDAPETDEPTETTAEPTTEATMNGSTNPDVPILNYALTLEHLENAFYRDGLAAFGEDELMEADVLSEFGESVRMDVPKYLERAGEHEAAHVEALTATVEDLGGTPVEEGEYDFGYETPSEFLATGKALENTGVAAYAGAAPKVTSNAVLEAAAGIHSVEARHASFLNLINGEFPFPKAIDEAKSVDEVLEIAGQFVTSEVDPAAITREESESLTYEREAENGVGDVDVLNYALTLEHLENAFYRDGLAAFGEDELMEADVLSEFGESVRMDVPKYLERAGEHEAAHVEALTATVEDLGGTPVEEGEYDFGYETPSEFLGVGKALENTGVAAYAGAAATVANDDVFSAAIGIHSVEARHASFLNELNVTAPFPKAVDQPKTMAEVEEIAGSFIVES
jgi:putative transposon-encoded protein